MTESTPKRIPRFVATALAAALIAALVACGDGSSSEVDPGNAAAAPDYGPALARAPAELADLYEPGGVVLEEGADAFEAQLERLRGYPVVVNKWASWCGPCREEFPHLQQQAAELLDEVAFVGLDSEDSTAAAETFLRDHPIPYPSYSDPKGEIARQIGADFGFPETVFYDADGTVTHVQRGPYTSEDDLADDIRRYALGDG
jgi:cytochrome c biogenesis protein CcmG, thiol:disulfide interchange protein DsbE